jgi:hypothetical protein
MSEGRVLMVGGTDPVYREVVAKELRFMGHDVTIVSFDEADEVCAKSFDSLDGMSISVDLEISEEDREKLLAMFGPPQIPLATSIGYVENVDGVGCFGAKRGKKGKLKKDWMR